MPLPAPRRGWTPTRTPPPRSPPCKRCGCPVEEQRQGSCCCCQGGCCTARADADTEPPPPESVRWVGGVWTAKCLGDLPAWLVVALPLVVVAPALPTSSPPAGDRLADSDQFAARLSLPSPEPPPRLFSA
ncbi:MAG: hypothetical protein U0736_13595 [Gemmataceae bacterium]